MEIGNGSCSTDAIYEMLKVVLNEAIEKTHARNEGGVKLSIIVEGDGCYIKSNGISPYLTRDTLHRVIADLHTIDTYLHNLSTPEKRSEKIPLEVIKAFAVLKKASAITNFDLGKLSEEKKNVICKVADEMLSGEHLGRQFPLAVWQTGSGTQSNMNVNEVIANRGNEIAGSKLLHPNDDVNKSQSSNDTFPTAMHIASIVTIEETLFPAMEKLIETFKRLEKENEGIVKSGRTHLQDAVPIAFSQEISGWRSMIEHSETQIKTAMNSLRELAFG